MSLISWEGAAHCRIEFSTRAGGVSTGRYTSLNLGLMTDDLPESVFENRRRLCSKTGVDGTRAAMARQVHGAEVKRAQPKGILSPQTHQACDGLWAEESGMAMLLLTADCFPVALYRRDATRKLAVIHAGWKGVLEGIAEHGIRALGSETAEAVVGPGIGVCCYEVGDKVARPFRERFGDDVLVGPRLNLRLALQRALGDAGCRSVHHVDRCTACETEAFFSHRRDSGVTGRQGVIAYLR